MHIPTVPPLPLRHPAAVGRVGSIGRPATVLPAAARPTGRRPRSLLAAAAAVVRSILRPLAARSVSG
jgi:hypothetical protein